MKFFIIDEFGAKSPYPGSSGTVIIIETSGELLEHTYTAGENVSALKAMMISAGKAVLFTPVEANYGKLLGLSKTSAPNGSPVTVVSTGIFTDPGWGLTPDTLYFIGDDGALTTTVPTTGMIICAGIAINSNTLKIEFSNPIVIT